MITNLPDTVRQLGNDEQFAFNCHPGVTCFTVCCRELELALTPYDVLRLKNRLNVSSSTFLDRYVIIEKDPKEPFPRFYLTMVDDGRASCVFVSEKGCTVYEDRPGACRAYPVGRGARQKQSGRIEEIHVLLQEPHCRGFSESKNHTAKNYITEQELSVYNESNDAVMTLLQHDKIKQGFMPSKEQLDRFTLALYDLDNFRTYLSSSDFTPNPEYGMDDTLALSGNDEKLLQLGIRWLQIELFGGNI